MSKISYPELVKKLADSYREVLGIADPIPIGELGTKVAETIKEIGPSLRYKQIRYNSDNTITLIDQDDQVHTIECIYTDGKISTIIQDGRNFKVNYEGDTLTNINNREFDFSNAPTENE